MLQPQWIAPSPEAVGVSNDGLQQLFARARDEVESGRLPSAQIALARRGRLAGMASFGLVVVGDEIQPATDASLYCVYSTTKGAIAVALWILIEEAGLRLDQRVAAIVPEFGANGKDGVTVEHLVTHTAGFPYAGVSPKVWDDRDARLEAFSRWELAWEPGSRFEYHATSAHWVLGEIIERLSGRPFQEFVRERVLSPIGLDDFHLGLPGELDARVATVLYTVPPVEPPGGWGSVSPDHLLVFNEPAHRRVGVPGGGAVTGAAELAMLYQPLVAGGVSADGTRILAAETIARATRVLTDERHRDPFFRVPVNRAVGVVVAGGDGRAAARGFTNEISAGAFGHGGAGGQIAWGDPTTGISLGFCTNGLGPWMETGRRVRDLARLALGCAIEG